MELDNLSLVDLRNLAKSKGKKNTGSIRGIWERAKGKARKRGGCL